MKTIEAKDIARKVAKRYAIGECDYQRDCGHSAIFEACCEAATEALAGQWRSVEDELPEEDREPFDTGVSLFLTEDFLVYADYGNGSFDYFVANRKKFESTEWLWWDSENDCEIKNVSYWMPIPEPPKTDKLNDIKQ